MVPVAFSVPFESLGFPVAKDISICGLECSNILLTEICSWFTELWQETEAKF